jgi:hypothetical protein
MISSDRQDVFDAGRAALRQHSTQALVRGRFVAIYLGLRRMGPAISPLGADHATPSSDIQSFLDELYTKTHRPGPRVVLSALFGGGPDGDNDGYSTRTGEVAPGNTTATNIWRNNFAIQKGVGCPADPAEITARLHDPLIRGGCPHLIELDDGHQCGLSGATYRGDEHSIWLRIVPGEGYQVVDLDEPAAYLRYLVAGFRRIPVFALIAALYGFAPPGVYPDRAVVGIPEFAEDFRFSLDQVAELFDCDPETPHNAMVLEPLLSDMGSAGSATVELAGAAVPAEDGETLPELGETTALNTGVGAELAVAEELTATGWTVVYRGNQRGFGYDLEASRDGQLIAVEVKSSVGFTVPLLTRDEWIAAQTWKYHFVLAVVDFYGTEGQRIWYVWHPAAEAPAPTEVVTTSHRFPRAGLVPLQVGVEDLADG